MKRQPLTPQSRRRALTAAEFQGLADVPPEVEWFANINNPRTREAYEHDLRDFMRFVGITRPAEFRVVTRAHVIAWRKDLHRRALAAATGVLVTNVSKVAVARSLQFRRLQALPIITV